MSYIPRLPENINPFGREPDPVEHDFWPLAKYLAEVADDTAGKFVVAAYGKNPETGTDIKEVRHVENGPAAAEDMITAAVELAAISGANVYILPALMRPDLPSGKKGGIGDVVETLAIVLDFDRHTGPAIDYAERLPAAPHFAVETSPGNFQAWLFFEAPQSPTEVQPALDALVAESGADRSGAEASHVFRVPGCLNWPNAAKIAEGRSPEPVQAKIVADASWDGGFSLVSLREAIERKWPAAFDRVTRLEKEGHEYVEREQKVPVQRDRLIDVLRHIPPDCNRKEWIKIIAGIRATRLRGIPPHEMDAALLEIAEAWSRGDYHGGKPPANWDSDGDVGATFRTLPPKPGGTTFGTLYTSAKGNGYDEPPPGPTSDDRWGEIVQGLTAEQRAKGCDGKRSRFEGPVAWGAEFRAREFATPAWIWRERLLAYEPNLYTGDAGIGKTTLAENLAVTVAAGAPFLDYETKRTQVFMLLGEDTYGPVRDNISQIAAALKIGHSDLDGRLHLLSIKSDPYPEERGHLLAEISDDGGVAVLPFMREVVLPYLEKLGDEVLWIIDPLAEFVRFNNLSDNACRALARKFLAPICTLNGGRVTVLANDHPSKSSMNDGSNVAGSVQLRASFSLTATLMLPKRASGLKGHRELVFKTLKARYAAETETPLYRANDCPAFRAGTAPAATLMVAKQNVYRLVYEGLQEDPQRLYRRDGRGSGDLAGPAEIAGKLGMTPDAVKTALGELRSDKWLQWVPNTGGSGGNISAHFGLGTKAPGDLSEEY